MASFIEKTAQRVRAAQKTIVLPEGGDLRTIEAAREIADEGIAKPLVLGNPSAIANFDIALDGIEIIDPKSSDLADELANELFEIRKVKGLSEEDARRLIENELYFGVMLVKTERADGMVAGAAHATADVIRPALQILKTAPGTSIVSAFFVMEVPDCEYGNHGSFLFADAGLNVSPSDDDLACIAVTSAESYRTLFEDVPKIAFLSHSTYGSSKGEAVDKVRSALTKARDLRADLLMDGELQLDAAIVKEVGQLKAPSSKVAGHANVLIFPELDSGNIGYKLVQRLAKANAYGPILQGLSKPVNDLSRGCVAKDIVGVAAITALQAL